MNLILMGLRGSGKTTIGRLIAASLSRPFLDLDELTPRLLNAPTLADAWRTQGEPAFRRAEADALRRTLAADGQVIALGGGTPTAPGAAGLLRKERDASRAILVYLAAEAPTLRARLAAADNTHRPSLTGADPLAEIDAVLAKRDPLYRELATEVIETEDLDEQAVARAVASLL